MMQRRATTILVAAFLLLGSFILTRRFYPLNSSAQIARKGSFNLDWSSAILSWANYLDVQHDTKSPGHSTSIAEPLSNNQNLDTLGIATHIFVISLARRPDRRSRMEVLRKAMYLRWDYVDALDKDDARITRIMDSVRRERSARNSSRTLDWPDRPEKFDFLGPRLVDYWPLDIESPNASSDAASPEVEPLYCAVGDDIVPKYRNISKVPYHLILSRGMVACWYSHLSVIRKIAELSLPDINTGGTDDQQVNKRDITAIVFEDDIDMEWDIHQRLASIWSQLPVNWDIVLLGHCWSDESYNPPLIKGSPLHPSHAPKCTHAYVLSGRGAKKLLTYLTYPPFAYSRALDQAIAFLIGSRRLRSFSVVPSIVVQRKEFDVAGLFAADADNDDEDGYVGDSDIWESDKNKGSVWRDTLVDSALMRTAKAALYNTDR